MSNFTSNHAVAYYRDHSALHRTRRLIVIKFLGRGTKTQPHFIMTEEHLALDAQ